jgi:(S)-2-hydroxyglutarate dehydrogenase
MKYDYIIIGGGIVGASTAWQLQRLFPKKNILLLEKEPDYARHQTGHNSGVIHAGVYYQPGSMKAEFCKRGAAATKSFCEKNNIPFIECGKLLVATNSLEMERMQALIDRCKLNGIDIDILDNKQLMREEPNIRGLGGILVKTTGIVNYTRVTKRMADQFQALNGEAFTEHEVTAISESDSEVIVSASYYGEKKIFRCRFLITCAGLQADRITKMMNISTNFRIIPFRGEYYRLTEKNDHIIKHLIYPIPDPDLPFLGVHLTRMIDGSVTIGPNAVLGWKREGYDRINFDLNDTRDTLTFPGFWHFAGSHYKTGLIEYKNSMLKPGYLKLVQKYCPELRLSDLLPYPAGIRAQAILKDGSMVHDFLFAGSPRSLHVCNAPSPAATSAIPIGEYICKRVAEVTM